MFSCRVRIICSGSSSYILLAKKCLINNNNSVHSSRGVMTTTINSAKDHIEVTKNQRRNTNIYDAIIHQICDISPTVKKVVLKVKQDSDEPFHFLPGQWLDLFIPGVETVGGFSFTSTPKQLTLNGTVDLAVKYSDWPPAYWVHTQAKEGSKVTVRSGGDFVLPDVLTGDYLFIAGGVGINPIASMIFQLVDINYSWNVQLLYTAKSVSELLFREEFNEIAQKNPKFRVNYFVTQPHFHENEHLNNDDTVSSCQYEGRRISTVDLDKFMNMKTTTLICGPPSLIQLATQSGHKCKDVHYEKWWISNTSEN